MELAVAYGTNEGRIERGRHPANDHPDTWARISDAAATVWADVLRINNTVSSLHLGLDSGGAGTPAVAEALKVNTTLIPLRLMVVGDWTRPATTGATTMAPALESTHTLRPSIFTLQNKTLCSITCNRAGARRCAARTSSHVFFHQDS